MSQLLAKTFLPTDKGHRVKETVIRSSVELLEFLEQRRVDPPSFFDLVAPSGVTATVGAGGSLWCLMFLAADGEPPYFWLKNEEAAEVESLEDIEFDACGTLTPVPPERLVTPAKVKAACIEFLRTGDRPEGEAFAWDED